MSLSLHCACCWCRRVLEHSHSVETTPAHEHMVQGGAGAPQIPSESASVLWCYMSCGIIYEWFSWHVGGMSTTVLHVALLVLTKC